MSELPDDDTATDQKNDSGNNSLTNAEARAKILDAMHDYAAEMQMKCQHHMWEFVMDALTLSSFDPKGIEMKHLFQKWRKQDEKTVMKVLHRMIGELRSWMQKHAPASLDEVLEIIGNEEYYTFEDDESHTSNDT